MKHTLPDRVRVGVFELDLRGGELRNGEDSVWLQEQPLSVLRMLVERAGEAVTREELKQKLWPNDTIVDFDHSINTAIPPSGSCAKPSAILPMNPNTSRRWPGGATGCWFRWSG